MRIWTIFFLALLFTGCTTTAELPLGTCTPKQQVAKAAQDTEKSGCCSWHDGVCGCYFGRAKCCDGTLSPTCGC